MDACAEGWSICGDDGDPTILSTRATAAQCASGASTGAFAAALSHCSAFPASACEYVLPLGCLVSGSCSEPVCCGPACRGDQGCTGGVYSEPDTLIAAVFDEGCGAMTTTSITGVLCCHD